MLADCHSARRSNLPEKDKKKQIIELTSIRGIAAWWVVFYHFGAYWDDHLGHWATMFVGQGYLAVDLFFILSGFVIFLVHGREFTKLTLPETRVFLIKRLARIYPLHLVILLIYLSIPVSHMAFSSSGEVPGRYEISGFIYNVLLVQNWGQYPSTSWNVPSWSISAEWAAYLSFPVIAFCVNKVANSTAALLTGLAFLLLVPTGIIFALGIDSLGQLIIGSGVFRCLFQFAIGCILFVLYRRHGDFLKTFSPAILCVGIIAFLPIAFGLLSDIFLTPMAFALIILALTRDESPLTGILRHRAVIYLGEISYSTYMIHYFVYEWFKLLFIETEGQASLLELSGAFLVVLALSAGLHRFLEVPAQNLFRSFSRSKTPGHRRTPKQEV